MRKENYHSLGIYSLGAPLDGWMDDGTGEL